MASSCIDGTRVVEWTDHTSFYHTSAHGSLTNCWHQLTLDQKKNLDDPAGFVFCIIGSSSLTKYWACTESVRTSKSKKKEKVSSFVLQQFIQLFLFERKKTKSGHYCQKQKQNHCTGWWNCTHKQKFFQFLCWPTSIVFCQYHHLIFLSGWHWVDVKQNQRWNDHQKNKHNQGKSI